MSHAAAAASFPDPVPVPSSLDAWRAQMLAAGFDEVLEREWAPHTVVGTHTHPFDAEAVVVRGEMWLTVAGQTRHLGPGGRFSLPRETPHAERYGASGAAYWVARRSASRA
ncbi:MAG: cupin domain-containing protein [Rubrivivax sp.]|nr:cupin domain-containing protein [Rubrivivax sp.]